MHVTRCLEGEIDAENSSTSERQCSVDIAKFGKLYSAILLTHGEAQAPQAENTWCKRQFLYIENCMGKSPIVKKIV